MNSLRLFLLLSVFLSSSCKTNKVDLLHPENNGELILSMERTPCFGACPVYEIKLYSNGLLLYNGKRFTEKIGCCYRKVTKQEVKSVADYIASSGFFALENKYPVLGKAPTDLPGSTLYFKHGTNEKTITEHSWETPVLLIEIEKKVDSLIQLKILQFCDN